MQPSLFGPRMRPASSCGRKVPRFPAVSTTGKDSLRTLTRGLLPKLVYPRHAARVSRVLNDALAMLPSRCCGIFLEAVEWASFAITRVSEMQFSHAS